MPWLCAAAPDPLEGDLAESHDLDGLCQIGSGRSAISSVTVSTVFGGAQRVPSTARVSCPWGCDGLDDQPLGLEVPQGS